MWRRIAHVLLIGGSLLQAAPAVYAQAPASLLPPPAAGPLLFDPQITDAPPQRLPPIEAVLVEAAPAEEIPAPANPTPVPAATKGESEAKVEGQVIDFVPGWQVWQPAFWDPWEGNVELGLNGTDGNTETFNVRFGVTAKHKTDSLVQTFQLTSIQKRANGVTTANTALLDGRLEWPMAGSRWNYFMHSLLEHDQFKAFTYRISADTGFGYDFIKSDATTLLGRAGISMSREIGGTNDVTKPELLFGGEYKHKFNDTHNISAKIDAFPNLENFGDIRVNSQAAWEMALSKIWGLSLKLSVIDRYDSTPQGARPNDIDYSTLLLWAF
jgi:putative salt-induced outer membrane protein YdiY